MGCKDDMKQQRLDGDTKGRAFWIGVDIGGTKTAVVLSSGLPGVHSRVEFPTRPEQGPNQALRQIETAIAQIITSNSIGPQELRCIGVSCGSPLDRHTGVIQAPPNLPTWVDIPICKILEGRFAVECQLENDANAGAVAEHRFGAGRGTESMVFLTLGTGIGAGMILNGQIYHGASDLAGEIGHVRLTSKGPIGYGKIGSVEGWSSGQGMALTAVGTIRDALLRGQTTSLESHLEEGTLTSRNIGMAARLGDAIALRIVRQTGRRLGAALAILVDIVNPECIVVGGLAVHLGDILLTPARQVLEREALSASVSICDVVPASLGESIGDIAALCVAMEIGKPRSKGIPQNEPQSHAISTGSL